MYKLHISAQARNKLKQISKRKRKAVVEALEEIKEDPYLGKPLKRELTERYSYKLGVYRIIYKVNEKDRVAEIITVGHRATVYN